MVALRTLIDETLCLWHVVAHPVLEMSVTEMSQQELATLEGSLAQRTILPGASNLKLFEHGEVVAIGPTHGLIEHLDDHLVRDAPVSDHGDLVSKVLTTQRTKEGRVGGQLPGKPFHEVFVCGVSHEDLNIATDGAASLDRTLVVDIIRLGTPG